MRMRLEDFRKQRRGPYAFDRWQWKQRVASKLGALVVELSLLDKNPTPPDEAMVAVAQELATFVLAHEETILDLIHGHYRYAEKEGWLEFWKVPAGIRREDILSQVSIELAVARDLDEKAPYEASVHVDPTWDPEHKLDLRYRKGKIVEANGERFVLTGGILYLK